MNRENTNKLSIGMTKKEVLDIMGTKTKSYYEIGIVRGFFRGLFTLGILWFVDAVPAGKISHPYRTEILQGKDKTFECLYYYTDIKRQDGAITDDESTPLIFDNGKIIGWGWSFMKENINKYEIRVR